MFHRGEKGAAIIDGDGSAIPVTVLRGLADPRPRKLFFGRNGPEWRGAPSSLPLLELRRQDNGQRLIMHRDFELVEVPG